MGRSNPDPPHQKKPPTKMEKEKKKNLRKEYVSVKKDHDGRGHQLVESTRGTTR